MTDNLDDISRDVKRLVIQSLKPNTSHHIGCSLSIVDILIYLYSKVLKVFPKQTKNENRDIFILSKGHGALALYTVLANKGFFNKKLLSSYDREGGRLPEHASTLCPGVELSTGSLGHGLPVGAGFATAFKNDKKNNKTYVLMSDGEFDEGSNWEAIMYSGHHKLSNLIIIVDVNNFQGYASTNKVIDLSPFDKKLADFNWDTYHTNGHDFKNMEKVFNQIRKSENNQPKIVFAHTVKGKGIPFFEGKFDSHYKSIDEITQKKILDNL